MPNATDWVTFQTIRMPDGQILLVQKHPDGSSRTILVTR